MAEDLGDRTEQATPKRREDARRDGQIARSMDLGSALLLLAVTIILFVLTMPSLDKAKTLLSNVLNDSSVAAQLDATSAGELISYVAVNALRIGAPILLLAWLASYLATFWQVGWLFTLKPIEPKLDKLNPLTGAKRIFGLTGLVKVTLDSLKVLVVLAVVMLTVYADREQILLLPYLGMMAALGTVGSMMFDLAMRVLVVLLILGLFDYMYQRWKQSQDLRMTKQQVKDEMKQSEGDPETKRRRQRVQQQLAMQRLGAAVPKADVIVTNPEHISIAIQYDADTMMAPKVVAKGADFVAMRIRHIAMQHGIPIVERKPLARALYREVKVGQEIPPGFYQAVAEILAYVFRLNEGQRSGQPQPA